MINKLMSQRARELRMLGESPKKEPAVKAIKKANREAEQAFKKTRLYKLQELCKHRSFWQRRRTIANNKLAAIEDQLDAFATELANEVDT